MYVEVGATQVLTSLSMLSAVKVMVTLEISRAARLGMHRVATASSAVVAAYRRRCDWRAPGTPLKLSQLPYRSFPQD